MKLIDDLRQDLAAFVEQRDALTLVLWTKSHTDLLYVVKLLESLDEASQRDIYISFTEDCFDPARYVDSLMAACDLEIETANEAMRQGLGDEGVEPWAPLPAPCFDERLRPRARIEALVTHVRRYYPDPAHRIVLALVPTQLSNPAAYREIAHELIPRDGYEPWMAGVRIVLCDLRRTPIFVRELIEEDAFGTLVRPIDFSPDALTAGLAETAQDREAPIEQRMSAFLQVAALDHAWGRHEEAIRKYSTAFRYYQSTNNVPLQGVSLLFAGYSFDQLQQGPRARQKYEQALALATADKNKQLMLNALLALGGLTSARRSGASPRSTGRPRRGSRRI